MSPELKAGVGSSGVISYVRRGGDACEWWRKPALAQVPKVRISPWIGAAMRHDVSVRACRQYRRLSIRYQVRDPVSIETHGEPRTPKDDYSANAVGPVQSNAHNCKEETRHA